MSVLDGLFGGGCEEIPQWYLREQGFQGQTDYALAKRIYELENQVGALTTLVREMRVAANTGKA